MPTEMEVICRRHPEILWFVTCDNFAPTGCCVVRLPSVQKMSGLGIGALASTPPRIHRRMWILSLGG